MTSTDPSKAAQAQSHLRGLVKDEHLRKVFASEKKSGRPSGVNPPTRLARLVWFARRVRIPYADIQRAVGRDYRWAQTRVTQVDTAIADGKLLTPEFQRLMGRAYERLPHKERCQRILAKLAELKHFAIE